MIYASQTGFYVDYNPARADQYIVSTAPGAVPSVSFIANPMTPSAVVQDNEFSGGIRGPGIGGGMTPAAAVQGLVNSSTPTSACGLMALSIIAGGSFT
jgi:hypothetical protein